MILIVNIDQTDIILVLKANHATYEIKRAKKIFIYRKYKKRTFTFPLSGLYIS